jgi:hypothetical protein
MDGVTYFAACLGEFRKTIRERLVAGKVDYEVRYSLADPARTMSFPAKPWVTSKPFSFRVLPPMGADEDALWNSPPRRWSEDMWFADHMTSI